MKQSILLGFFPFLCSTDCKKQEFVTHRYHLYTISNNICILLLHGELDKKRHQLLLQLNVTFLYYDKMRMFPCEFVNFSFTIPVAFHIVFFYFYFNSSIPFNFCVFLHRNFCTLHDFNFR